jgi:hypothetical protein
MIGDADCGEPGEPGFLQECLSGKSPIGIHRMEMQISLLIHAVPAELKERNVRQRYLLLNFS